LPSPRAEISIADGIYFENQLRCGNPVPVMHKRTGQGCDQGKRQTDLFRLAKRARIPKKDFFLLDSGPRLALDRTFAVSARARDTFAEFTGCEVRPILAAEGGSESGLFQVTVTGSTAGAIEISRPLVGGRVIYCGLCDYWFGTPPDPWYSMRSYPRDLFADLDLQVCDRLRVRGEDRVIVGGEPFVVASWRVIKAIAENGWKGFARDRKLGFVPVTLEPVS
jgi:hypothetical protein